MRYYVLDGHHRVAAAKEFGFKEIEARIVQVIQADDTLESTLYRERGISMKRQTFRNSSSSQKWGDTAI